MHSRLDLLHTQLDLIHRYFTYYTYHLLLIFFTTNCIVVFQTALLSGRWVGLGRGSMLTGRPNTQARMWSVIYNTLITIVVEP
jgi:hypothetical protein